MENKTKLQHTQEHNS